jgi:hypothetical protein
MRKTSHRNLVRISHFNKNNNVTVLLMRKELSFVDGTELGRKFVQDQEIMFSMSSLRAATS